MYCEQSRVIIHSMSNFLFVEKGDLLCMIVSVEGFKKKEQEVNFRIANYYRFVLYMPDAAMRERSPRKKRNLLASQRTFGGGDIIRDFGCRIPIFPFRYQPQET